MSTLVRNDGSVFLVEVYREQLKKQKPNRLRSALRYLSSQHGRYVRLVEDSLGNVDVALDKTAGFLLGETFARHFKKGEDYIYIERLEKADQALLVVIENGKVILDAVVFQSDIWQELIPIIAVKSRYRIYHFGFGDDEPIELSLDEPTVGRASEILTRATALPKSVFDSLPLDDDLQLLPCEKAVQQSSFSGAATKNTVFFVIAFCFVMLLVGIFQSGRPPTEAGKPRTPYSLYYHGVSDEPAEQVVGFVLSVVSQIAAAPELNLDQIDYRRQELRLGFANKDDKLTPLLSWSKDNQFHFELHSTSAHLIRQQRFAPVKTAEKIYSAQDLYVYLSDHLRSILPGSNFRLLSTHQSSHWKSLACEWQVVGLSPTGLKLLQKLLADMPVSCSKISLSYRDALMQGTISFVIWGS